MSYIGHLLNAGIDTQKEHFIKFLRARYLKTINDNEIYPVVPVDATVQAEAATTTLVAADFGLNLTNTGASGAVVYTLPAASAVAGKCARINITAAHQVSLSPVAADAIYLGGNGVDNKDVVIAGVIGNYVDLFSDGTNFFVTGYSGVVTKQAYAL